MSKKQIPLDKAQHLAERILKRFAPDGGGYVAGSVRRGKPVVGDIEILLPLPATLPGGEVEPDLIFLTMQPFVITKSKPANLFDPPEDTSNKWFHPVKGFKDGFRYCQLSCEPSEVWNGNAASFPAFNVDVFRYEPGAEGNLGGVMLVRTGSKEFSAAVATWWKRRGGYMSHNFFIDSDGVQAPQVTEEQVFGLLGMKYIEPQDRHGGVQVTPLQQPAQV